MTNNIIVMIGFNIKFYHKNNIENNTTNKILFNVSYILPLIINIIDKVNFTLIVTIFILMSLEIILTHT